IGIAAFARRSQSPAGFRRGRGRGGLLAATRCRGCALSCAAAPGRRGTARRRTHFVFGGGDANGESMRERSAERHGAVLMAASALAFALMGLLVKLASERLPSQEIVLARAVITLFLSLAMLRQAKLAPWGKRPLLLTLRGVLGMAALNCHYYALDALPLGDATAIHFVNPIFTALLAAPLLGERLAWLHAASVAAGMLGVIFVQKPQFLFASPDPLEPTAVAIAVLGALLSAAAYVTVRKLRATEDPLVIVFYLALVTVVASLPFAAQQWVAPTPWEWLLFLGIGATTQAGQVCLTRALHLLPAGRATAIGYLQIVFAATFGAIFYGEAQDPWGLLGIVLIVGGTLCLGREPAATPGGQGPAPPSAGATAEIPRAADR
ncbi:MAG: DMT family transporter, partial [Planctomycetes bacterium]|nr:DMT family transporter [Planctomycetota bacterium]